MAKRLGLRQIAEQAGVSVATVSRVLNNKPDVNRETRERVMEFLADMESQSRSAHSSSSRSLLIGFVNTFRPYPASNLYVAGLLAGFQERCSEHAYDPVLIEGDMIEREIRWPGRYEILRQLSGLVWSMPVFTERHRAFLKERSLPCVVINNRQEGVDVPFIEGDNLTAARQAVEYLVGMGHTRIGFMGGAHELANFTDRQRGYYQHMKEHGLAVDPDWVVDDLARPEYTNAVEGTHRLVGRGNLPTALICAAETITLGVYDVFAQRGIRIPDDVSVLGYDDTVISSHLAAPVTTFRQHLDTMGERAVDLVMQMIHHPEQLDEKTHILEPMTLVVRKSVRSLARSTEPGVPASA